MTITAQDVKALREQTGAGMMECKKALQEADGNADKAIEIIRERGLAKAESRSGRDTAQGRVGCHIHNGVIGAMVEVQCETDFVAKTDDFNELVKMLCLHVTGMSPEVVSREDLSAELVEAEKAKYAEETAGKPEEIAAKILNGKLEKNLFSQKCLLDQPYVNDGVFDGTVGELVKSYVAKIGENIRVAQFARFSLMG